MKKLSSRLFILKAAILYCLIFCWCGNDVHASNSSLSKTTDKNYLASCLADTSDFYCHSIHAGIVAGTTILPRFKNTAPGFFDLAHLKLPDHRLKFSPYILYSGNISTRLRKNDFLYPFHYFW